MSEKKIKPLPENRTIAIDPNFHVGWFYGSEKLGSRRIFVGLGAPMRNHPSDGKWLTIPEARELRDVLNRILESNK